MRPRHGLALALLSSTMWVLLAFRPLPAFGFELPGCALRLTAVDAAGNPTGSATAGADDARQQAPLTVPPDGSLDWVALDPDGSLGPPAGVSDWHVEVYGIPTVIRGSAPSASSTGSIRIRDIVPFRLVGLFQVSGEWRVGGKLCRGSGWLQLTGEPFSSLPFSVALALLLVGVVLLSVGIRGSPAAAVGGGVMLGAGAIALMVTYGQLPFGGRSPLAVLLIGLLLGTIAGLVGSRSARGSAAVPAARMGAGGRF